MTMIKGQAYWCKITGKPRLNKFTERNQWSFDLAVDKHTVKLLDKMGLKSKIRNNGDDRGDFITFKREEFKNTKDGTKVPNQPIKIVDAQGKPWDGRLIGNGSVLNVVFNVYETKTPKGPSLGVAVLSVQVWDHKPYEPPSEFPVKEQHNDGTAEDWSEEAA